MRFLLNSETGQHWDYCRAILGDGNLLGCFRGSVTEGSGEEALRYAEAGGAADA
jgi:hypothetical protein